MFLGFDYDLVAYPRYKVVGVHSRGEYHLEISDVRLSSFVVLECRLKPTAFVYHHGEDPSKIITANILVFIDCLCTFGSCDFSLAGQIVGRC